MRIKNYLHRYLLFPLVLIFVFVGAVGCQLSTSDEQVSPDPFSVTFGLGEGDTELTLNGNSAGHIAGKSSEFELLLNNKSTEITWKGEYYIVLLDSEDIILEIGEASFELAPLDSVQKTIPVKFPEQLDGPYGLTVIIPGRGASISTIWIGEKTTGKVGKWPDIREYRSYSMDDLALAEDFVINSPTFLFDGIDETLKLTNTAAYSEKTISKNNTGDTINSCVFTFTFESSSAGYGDRSGQMVSQVITPHEAVIAVEQGKIISAILDNVWDIVNQKLLK